MSMGEMRKEIDHFSPENADAILMASVAVAAAAAQTWSVSLHEDFPGFWNAGC